MSKLHLIYLIIITFFVVAGTFLYSNRTYATHLNCTYTFDWCACDFLDNYFDPEYTHAAQHVASQESACKSNLCECNGTVCPPWSREGATCEEQGVGLFQLRHYHCGTGPLSADHQQCYSDRLDPGKNAAATAILTSGGSLWGVTTFGGAACFASGELNEDTCPGNPNYYCPEKDSADGIWECSPPCDTPINMSGNRHRINNGSTCYINRYGVCKEIINNSGYDLFVGSKSSEEWSSFYNNYPSGVSVVNCDCSLPPACPSP